MASNGSKPYQAQLIAEKGLEVPATLVTTDPEEVLRFREHHGRLVCKSISGARSLVRELQDEDLERLDDIRWCPVQFQEHVDGIDVWVHVVGREVFATAIRSEASDYRYAMRLLGDAPALSAVEVSDSLAERCVRLTAALGLEFLGIDLRVTPDGRAVCFEVNPSPGVQLLRIPHRPAHRGRSPTAPRRDGSAEPSPSIRAQLRQRLLTRMVLAGPGPVLITGSGEGTAHGDDHHPDAGTRVDFQGAFHGSPIASGTEPGAIQLPGFSRNGQETGNMCPSGTTLM
jgi:hypothetical protein